MVIIFLVFFTALFRDVTSYSLCPGEYAQYSACPDCTPTCSNPSPQQCNYFNCQNGCGCKKGYVKDDDTGVCIPREKCAYKKCGPNEKFSNCPSRCPASCDDPNPICDKMCGPPGCVCKKGYVRDKYGDCIPKKMCPGNKLCGKNERWNDSCVPPPICQEPNCSDKVPRYCPLYCTYGGCVCKPGFVRNKVGRCVSPEDCPVDPCDCDDEPDCDCGNDDDDDDGDDDDDDDECDDCKKR